MSDVSDAVAAAQAAISALGRLTPGSSAITSAIGYVATAQSVVAASITSTEAAIAATSIASGSDLATATDQCGTLARLLNTNAYLGRVARNLA